MYEYRAYKMYEFSVSTTDESIHYKNRYEYVNMFFAVKGGTAFCRWAAEYAGVSESW